MFKKIIWALVVLSVVAAIPLMLDRFSAENSVKRVEVVADFTKIENLASRAFDPVPLEESLPRLKEQGFTSVAIYEKTADDLRKQGIFAVYDHSNIGGLGSTVPTTVAEEVATGQSTLLLFTSTRDKVEIETYAEMFKQAFNAQLNEVQIEGRPGLLIQRTWASLEKAALGFDLNVVAKLTQTYDLAAVARIKTQRHWNEQLLAWQFEQLHRLGVQTIVFDGSEVLGYPDPEKMGKIAEWMKAYQMNIGLVEFHEQAGATFIGKATDLASIRLLSVTDRELATNSIQKTSNMLALGIKERNIRMIYLHLPYQDQYSSSFIFDRLGAVVQTTAAEIKDQGYIYQQTAPLYEPHAREQAWYNVLVIVGFLLLASLFLALFHPFLAYVPVPVGLLLYVSKGLFISELLLGQLFALAAAILAPAFATILAVRWLKNQVHSKQPLLHSIVVYVLTSICSLYGAVVTVALLNDLVFVQYLEQFRGVKLLYVAPSILVFCYLWLTQTKGELWSKTVYVYRYPVQVNHILLVASIGLLAAYFLARSGNEASVLPMELQMRDFLNNLFGVRPRTKEFLLGHPLFLLASYLVLKYKRGSWLFLVGVVGQMSLVSTFTHLHTPLIISFERTLNGLAAGLVVGVVLMLIWEVAARMLKKWKRVSDYAG